MKQGELLENKGIKINDITLSNIDKIINYEDFVKNNSIKISFGKKKHFLIKID